jgi:hypothetical protein
VNPSHRAIAESLLTDIRWQDDRLGYCKCPGEAQHNSPTKPDHCRITMDGVPTIFCFHSSCWTDVEQANHVLRSAIAKYDYRPDPKLPRPVARPLTPEEIAVKRQKLDQERLKAHSQKSLQVILQQNQMSMADWFELSPSRLLDDPADDWRLLLSLFHDDDVVWIGGKFSSCSHNKPASEIMRCQKFFRPVKEWLRLQACPDQFTCPSTFKPGTYSRCNYNVVTRRFLVIESDYLSKDDMCAVINWCRRFMKLRAIVDTAGKSLHGWFDAPPPDLEAELKLVLPNLGREGKTPTLDPALFKLAQPCRLPGAMRDDKRQCLLYLDNSL